MPRRRAPELMRWKLELPGTSRIHAQAIEAAVDEVGWQRLGSTEVLFGPAVTRIYIATDQGESAEHLAIELVEHTNTRIPSITGTKPTTWPEVFAQLRRTKATRARNARRDRAAQRPTGPQPLPGFA
jgi:hypothetical protein